MKTASGSYQEQKKGDLGFRVGLVLYHSCLKLPQMLDKHRGGEAEAGCGQGQEGRRLHNQSLHQLTTHVKPRHELS